ncbi:MAG: transposase [Microcoleus sp. SU_5_3]|nr:transposase [Microcoleus sp. SU_5_3]
MKITYQYRFYPDSTQKIELNEWLRISRYWYNRQLGERFDWWQNNQLQLQAFPHWKEIFPTLFAQRPNYYSQKLQLPAIKQDLVRVMHSGELLDFSRVDSTILQEICKRVDQAFKRFIIGDFNGKRSGKPRLKTAASFRTMTWAAAKDDWIKLVRKNWLYLRLPKIGVVKVRMHRPLPNGFTLKQVSVTKKLDGWFMQICLEDTAVPEFNPDRVIPTWENSMGLDAVLHGDDYLATSEGDKLPSHKALRRNQQKLSKISRKKHQKKRSSRARRKLAKQEGKQHQKIARSRKDFQYKTAHKLVRTGKKVFLIEQLNLPGLSRRNAPKHDESGKFLPNGQSAKSGLNKSWMDAAFGQFFEILGYIASKAGATVIPQNPAYTSQLLCYRNEIVFTNLEVRDYWDEIESLMVDRDVNAAINLKRLGLGIMPSIKRRGGKIVVVGTMAESTAKEILNILNRTSEAYTIPFGLV